MTGYYRRFIRNYGSLAAGLTTLLKNNSFKWVEVVEQSFTMLKRALTQLPFLALPDFSKTFCIEYDASGRGRSSAHATRQVHFFYELGVKRKGSYAINL